VQVFLSDRNFGTVAREDLVKAARECGDADFDVLIACAFSYEAHTTELKNSPYSRSQSTYER